MNRKIRMYNALSSGLLPVFIEINDDSHGHRRQGTETHFSVVLVSNHFHGKTRIDRHRIVHELVKNEFDNGLHALSLNLYTPEEWHNRGKQNPLPPPCQHQ